MRNEYVSSVLNKTGSAYHSIFELLSSKAVPVIDHFDPSLLTPGIQALRHAKFRQKTPLIDVHTMLQSEAESVGSSSQFQWLTLSILSALGCYCCYPCNHCAQRRRPERCVYNILPVAQSLTALPLVSEDRIHISEHPRHSRGERNIENSNLPSFAPCNATPDSNDRQSNLIESFGYVEDSNSNTMALLKMASGMAITYMIYRSKD